MNTNQIVELVKFADSLLNDNCFKDKAIDFCGEALRYLFFSDEGFGCYDNFELRKGVKSLPEEYNEDEEAAFTCAELNGIKMKYHWDGDGTLLFELPDDIMLYNSDCKKSNVWELM
jgi:hypothetical protein